jgi:hypothetical protein
MKKLKSHHLVHALFAICAGLGALLRIMFNA